MEFLAVLCSNKGLESVKIYLVNLVYENKILVPGSGKVGNVHCLTYWF